ncbi:MAG: AmmeMemoRadiSam system protein A [Halorhodospira halophila]|uniref:AmmeMemoRadiSam system protein A n=1 Tax=Halorhodospira TaxID=85108 RepID=UPI0019133EC1|nr:MULTISPECIES: AmmeMemoRadiSam system protein A [Halorhodospira]MCC3749776.1 AmmeMemoRadiSam system protein A [Halorhodospira halophila]MCG5527692.1 AmmeMemoRadiSam system protein A [Halorhodospira halophila]MCG5534033.1 AmmeMemoRadiSam system protein A [Halorhodospira sp. 9621]MCG5537734.1 AmmeMemoRadiSam system protein A [Halorhodospira sp. 9622]MCG5539917.1 AmmeMemoRadiSam system protein A [Halorhodospira sp. M39old]
MSSTEQTPIGTDVPSEHGALLPRFARQNIAHQQEVGEPLPIASGLPEALTRPGAAFVSLHQGDVLRGCMGSLVPRQPLVRSVMDSALEAAFSDPRFDPVTREELDALTVKVAVLGEAEPLEVEHEAQLLEELVPGEDGLILHDGLRRATFLPAVWEGLPDPQEFLAQLKLKAGLPPDYWSRTLQFARYRSVTFTDTPRAP